MSSQGRILVVEDHESERRAISQILKSEGFTVFGAENADKALGYIEENIDVVLSDLHMGDVSGLDLLQNIWSCFFQELIRIFQGNSLETVVILFPVYPQTQRKQVFLDYEFARDAAAVGTAEKCADRGNDGVERQPHGRNGDA